MEIDVLASLNSNQYSHYDSCPQIVVIEFGGMMLLSS